MVSGKNRIDKMYIDMLRLVDEDEVEETEIDDDKYKCCSLSETRNNIVWWRGTTDKNVDVLFVGEAPGRDEDLQGKPFVGRAGKLLDKWIDEIGIEKYAIINIVKCRPPNNRVPTKEEINACLPHFINQVKELNPKLIVSLGRIACTVLIGRSEVTENIGKIFKTKYGRVIVFPHPSYVLRGVRVDIPIEKLKKIITLI